MSALLHLVGFAPDAEDAMAALHAAVHPDDTLVLLDAGTAFAAPAHRARLPDCALLRLLPGATAPGPEPGDPQAPMVIDYNDLVRLTETHRGPASWY